MPEGQIRKRKVMRRRRRRMTRRGMRRIRGMRRVEIMRSIKRITRMTRRRGNKTEMDEENEEVTEKQDEIIDFLVIDNFFTPFIQYVLHFLCIVVSVSAFFHVYFFKSTKLKNSRLIIGGQKRGLPPS